jgi:hypothetical protein
VGGAEAGEEAEGEVEAADVESGEGLERSGGDAEVGEEPECSGGQGGGEPGCEGVEFELGEAVEEEVGDDEVGGMGGGVGEGAGVVGVEAVGGWVAALVKELEHGGAGVDCVCVEVGVGGEEAGEEATVAVAEDQGAAAVEETGEEVVAGAFEGSGEGEVFEPAVGAGDAIEVGGWGGGHG